MLWNSSKFQPAQSKLKKKTNNELRAHYTNHPPPAMLPSCFYLGLPLCIDNFVLTHAQRESLRISKYAFKSARLLNNYVLRTHSRRCAILVNHPKLIIRNPNLPRESGLQRATVSHIRVNLIQLSHSVLINPS